MKPGACIDPADRLRVEQAVIAAEVNTSGEIVVVVTDACDGYRGARWRAALLQTLLVSCAWVAFVPGTEPAVLLLLQALSLMLGRALCRIDAVLRLFLSESLMERRARQRAAAAFHEHGLSRTAGRSGVLLFVALLEHRVIVLGDTGVDALLDPDERWSDVVATVLSRVAGGDLCDGLIRGVQKIGDILSRHLPAPPRNVDELPTALVIEER